MENYYHFIPKIKIAQRRAQAKTRPFGNRKTREELAHLVRRGNKGRKTHCKTQTPLQPILHRLDNVI